MTELTFTTPKGQTFCLNPRYLKSWMQDPDDDTRRVIVIDEDPVKVYAVQETMMSITQQFRHAMKPPSTGLYPDTLEPRH